MRLEPLTNNRARLDFLNTAAQTSQIELQTETNRLTPEFTEEIAAMATSFQQSIVLFKDIYAERRSLIARHASKTNDLKSSCLDFIAVLKRRIRRKGHDVGVLEYYLLPGDHGSLSISTQKRAVQVSKDLISGDALAVSKGLDPMQNPSAVDIGNYLKIVEEAAVPLGTANSRIDTETGKLKAMQGQVDDLRQDVIRLVRKKSRELSATAQRNLLRRYGIEFISGGDEVIEEEVEEEVEDLIDAPAPTDQFAQASPSEGSERVADPALIGS